MGPGVPVLTHSNRRFIVSDIVRTQSEYTPEELQLLRDTIARGTTPDEFKLFLKIVAATGLDPFSRQIFAIKRWDKKANREIMQAQVSIDGFRVVACRTGKFRGRLGPLWCGADGVWKDVWLQDGYPAAAKVGVLVEGFSEPVWAVARWDSFVQTNKDGSVTHMWNKMPDHMLAKCAEAQALRVALPAYLSGVYAPEEMDQATNEPPAPKQPRKVDNAAVTVEPAEQAPKPAPALPDAKARYAEVLAAAREWVGEGEHKAATASLLKAFGWVPKTTPTMEQLDRVASLIEHATANGMTLAGVIERQTAAAGGAQ